MVYDADSDTYTCAKGEAAFRNGKKQRDRDSGYERTVRTYQYENCQYSLKTESMPADPDGKNRNRIKMIQYNLTTNPLLDKDYKFIQSKKESVAD